MILLKALLSTLQVMKLIMPLLLRKVVQVEDFFMQVHWLVFWHVGTKEYHLPDINMVFYILRIYSSQQCREKHNDEEETEELGGCKISA